MIDVVNDFDFEEGGELLSLALPVSNTEEENLHALKQMETVLKADVAGAAHLDLKAISR